MVGDITVPFQGAEVQPLVWELRPCMLCDMTKNIKIKSK